MELERFDITLIIDELILISQNLNFLNFPPILQSIILNFLDLFQKNEDLQSAIEHEILCLKYTFYYYGKRNKEELKQFVLCNGDLIMEMKMDLKKFCSKYKLDFSKLVDDCESLFEESHLEHANYTPTTRIDSEKYLVCADDELLEIISKKKLHLVYPEFILQLSNISSKNFSDYLEIVSLWIFLNISQLIQIHTNINQRNSNEIATLIVNFISPKKITRSAYEKASAIHIHPKAHGAYIYEYYGQIYYSDLTLVRKTIKLKEKTVKKTSFKNLKNIINVNLNINEKIRWNI